MVFNPKQLATVAANSPNTEVATDNQRSLNAHLNIGFKILKTQVSDGVSWELINWDWGS